MIYLLWVSMFMICYVCGRGFLTAADHFGKKSFEHSDSVLAGVMICIGAGEAAHLTALFLKWNYSDCIRLMKIIYSVLLLTGLGICLYDGMRHKRSQVRLYRGEESSRTSYYLGIMTAVIIVIQFVIIQVNEHIYLDGDMTVETVNTFLYSDKIYEINPLTGMAYEKGVPLRIRILCLPSLYAFLASVFHMSVIEVVWQGIPAFVLLCTYIALWGWGKFLFPGNAVRRNLFLLLAAFLLTVGDYKLGVDGFLLLQSGFRGTAIRSLVIFPYAVNTALRKKWILLAFCVLAEACITWTLYGAGVSLFTAAGVFVTENLLDKRKKRMI